MSRFQRSWSLAKASWGVLRSESSLALFPVVSFVASALVMAVFAGLVWLTLDTTPGADGTESYSVNVATWVLGFCLYVALAFVQTYFLAALCSSANDRLQGRDTTLGAGISVANTRLDRILPWAVVSATVSVILEAIEERLGFLGPIIAGLLGAAWNVVTFLTVPIIVFEDAGPVTALKRSGALLKQTWGENIIAQIGLGLIGFVAMLPGLALAAIGIASGVGAVIVAAIALGVVWVVLVSVVMNALSAIYRTALYRYAVDGTVPEPFAGTDMEHAFGPRKNRGRGGIAA